jgi:deoxyribodipyrimidine photo-lyase
VRTIVWFRGKDLRMSDHVPLRQAAAAGEVIPLFVLDPYFFEPVRARELPHRMQFLLDSLSALAKNLETRGTKLLVVPGKSVEVVPRLANEWRADRVVAHRWVEPFARERDERVAAALGERFQLFEGETLLPPDLLRSGSGTPFRVFTHFARAFRNAMPLAEPLPAPRSMPPLPALPCTTVPIPTLSDLGITRNPNLLPGGEAAARVRLRNFLATGVDSYAERRDRMDLAGTSRLSADLKFGTLAVREVWKLVSRESRVSQGRTVFQNELIWREFAYATLWHRPSVLKRPFRTAFATFPWGNSEGHWQAWVAGQTGYPIVDAACRQLVREGFVHNRARMIAASFLTKHLLVTYQRGEAHYMKYLTDGDWASNNMGWQWSAGCGCDAQPYFRVFNPVTQGQKFDPNGDYVRRWVPELASVPARFIHKPWEAPNDVLRAAGVELGGHYPRPIVDHRAARERFLQLASSVNAARSS